MSEAPYPPAEPPADGDWTGQVPPPGTPRYSASASVPNPPANQPPSPYGSFGQPAGPYGQPGQAPPNPFGQVPPAGAGGADAGFAAGQTPAAFGQPPQSSPFGQGAPQFGQPPAPPSGSARVGGSASVPVPPAGQAPTFGAPPQGYPGQSNVYGQGGAGTYGAPNAPQGPSGPPANYGPPAPSGGYGGGTYGAQPAAGQGGYPGGQTQAYGQPQSYGQPQPYGQPGQPEPGRGPRDKTTPTGGWPYVDGASPEAPKKSRKGITITVIVVAILVVVGVGGYVGLKLATGNNQFVVGACVKQGDNNSATVVDCSTSGAYRITKVVDSESGCGDPNQPSVVLVENNTTKYACLAPA